MKAGARWAGLLLALLIAAGASPACATTYHAYIGTARVPQKGAMPASSGEIFMIDVDSETGAMSNLRLIVKTPASVGWMALDPKRNILYAANEGGDGSVSAYAISPDTGNLRLLNTRPTKGSPAFIALHPSGKYLFAANYGGGSLAVFPVEADGSLGAMSDLFRAPHAADPVAGEPDPSRPPRIHWVGTDPSGKFVIANDHGRNKVFAFTIDLARGKLSPAPVPFVKVTGQDGPRHGQFSPDGKTFYDVAEFDGTVAVYDFSPRTARFTLRQVVPGLPADFRGANAAGELLISADGRFLYTTNRGHDTIATFRVGADGTVSFIGDTPSQSQSPRSIAFDPDGRFLFSVTELGDAVAAFRIDPKTGVATYARQAIALRGPRSILFMPISAGR